MAKLSLQELVSGKRSKKLITVANSIKGGNEASCHPSNSSSDWGHIINDGPGG